MKDWSAWVVKHQYPKAAQRVLRWLKQTDAEEETWCAADKLVELVVAAVDACSAYLMLFEGTDFGMAEKFNGVRDQAEVRILVLVGALARAQEELELALAPMPDQQAEKVLTDLLERAGLQPEEVQEWVALLRWQRAREQRYRQAPNPTGDNHGN